MSPADPNLPSRWPDRRASQHFVRSFRLTSARVTTFKVTATMDNMRRALTTIALVAVAGATLLVSCSWTRRSTPCEGFGMVTERRVSGLPSYQSMNITLLESLPLPKSVGLERVEHASYTGCAEGSGQIAGARSLAYYSVESPQACEMVAAIETALVDQGGTYRAIETIAPATEVRLRQTDLWRGTQHVTLTSGSDPMSFHAIVDHDDPHPSPQHSEGPALGAC